ncbi:DNA-binding protein [Paenibacillus sp. IHBB 3054]|uniref:DNA-binding protein n=1 Tax=Paenibacillus sp. IHBB 3054 TaxID=3425689 RepID=UPI003F6678B3
MLELDGMNADSLVDMLKLSFSWENWSAVIEISDKLFEIIAIAYETSQYNTKTPQKYQLKRNIVYYFGYSLLMKGVAYQKVGQYSESRKCIDQYSKLSWIKNLDEEGKEEVEFYKNMAKANGYVIELLEGNEEVLQEYVVFLQSIGKEELLNGMLTVLESAIRYNYSVDWVIDLFKDQIGEIGSKEKREDVRSYIDYKYLHATYLYKRKNIADSINLILDILILSGKLEDGTGFRKSVAFYELLRSEASDSQHEMHQEIMKNILEREFLNNEKDDLVADSRISN